MYVLFAVMSNLFTVFARAWAIHKRKGCALAMCYSMHTALHDTLVLPGNVREYLKQKGIDRQNVQTTHQMNEKRYLMQQAKIEEMEIELSALKLFKAKFEVNRNNSSKAKGDKKSFTVIDMPPTRRSLPIVTDAGPLDRVA